MGNCKKAPPERGKVTMVWRPSSGRYLSARRSVRGLIDAKKRQREGRSEEFALYQVIGIDAMLG
jgi:hypothetical protein